MSRLEDIKEKYMPVEYDFNLNKYDIDWLIEQAERVKKLDFKNGQLSRRLDCEEGIYQERENNLKIIIELIKEEKEKLEQRNKRYREAIEEALTEDDFEDAYNQLERIVNTLNQSMESESE